MRSARLVTAIALGGAAAAAVVGIVGWWTWHPGPHDRLRDDAYYEFAWAANVAAGRGPTVSDGATTSGVQLLWSLLLVPFAWLLSPAALPMLAPWLGALLHMATAWGWWRHCRDQATGIVVALCWLGNPLLLRECQNGQETALACLLASALWWWRRTSVPRWCGLAVLAVLARADLLALVGLLSLWRVGGLRPAAVLAPGWALAVWVACNLWLGGGLLPDSASPMAWLWHANQALADASWSGWAHSAWWFGRPALLGGPFALASAFGLGVLVFVVVRPWWPAALRAVPAALVGCASALGARDLATPGWAALLLALLPAASRRRVPRALSALFFGCLAIVVVHWAVRWYPRDYYVAPLVVGASAALVRLGRLRVLLLALPLVQLADRGRVVPEPLRGQQELELAGLHLATLVPAGERVGCFNSGLVTFHADVLAAPAARRAIVNLDGVVDARSFAALRAGRLDAWLDEQGVRFLLDNPVQFAGDPRLPHACGPWFGPTFRAEHDLVEVARFDALGVAGPRPGADSFRLYWRRGRGTPPALPSSPRLLGLAGDGGWIVAWPARAGQTLQRQDAEGQRHTLLTVPADTVVVVPIPGDGRPCQVSVQGQAEPVMALAPL